MLESRTKDALVKLVKTVEIVETVETVETEEIVETVETVETDPHISLYQLFEPIIFFVFTVALVMSHLASRPNSYQKISCAVSPHF